MILKVSGILMLLFIILIPLINVISCRTARPEEIVKLIAVGHRGAAGLAPENTLAAIDSALAHHADLLEIDIRQTLDSQLVIMHDKSINRTTNGKGKINELTFKELRKYEANACWGGNYDSVKIPLLTEVLEKIKSVPVKLIIEIKDPELYPDIAERLVKLIREKGFEQKVLIFSFNKNVLNTINTLVPEIETGIFCTGFENINKLPSVDYISPHWSSLLYKPSLTTAIHKKRSKILVWTVNNKFLVNYLACLDIDGIITNHPEF